MRQSPKQAEGSREGEENGESSDKEDEQGLSNGNDAGPMGLYDIYQPSRCPKNCLVL